jgi:FkbM family methyltransferase
MVDIGAGTGTGPESFMLEVGLAPENCVLIEACPENFGHLAKRCPSARLLNIAIADRDGTVPFYVADDSRWEGSSKSNTIVEGVMETKFAATMRRIEVPSRTLATLFAEQKLDHVELLMLNCEGAEYIIFRDGIACLRNTRFVWLEFHGFSRALNKFIADKRGIFDMFEAAGFTRVAGMRRDEIDDSFVHTMVLFERLN